MLAGDERKELRHDRHTVSLLTDHMVFSPKYRGKVLVSAMGKETNRLFKRTDSMMNVLSRLPDDKVEMIQNEMIDNAYHLIEDAKLLIK